MGPWFTGRVFGNRPQVLPATSRLDFMIQCHESTGNIPDAIIQ